MTQFVIWNTTQKKYVARPGSRSSYTAYLQSARAFPSADAAQRECCGDEVVRNVRDILEGNDR